MSCGRFAVGMPTTCVAVTDSSGNTPESIVEVALSPSGQLLTVLTQTQLQFWSALRVTTQLASVALPKCGLRAGGDAGHKMIWNPMGRSLAVATLDRRVLFVEADVQLENHDVVGVRQDALHYADIPSRICIGFEVQLEYGLIVCLAATSQALVVCTSGGFLVFVGWNRGRVLCSWGSSHALQRVGPAMGASRHRGSPIGSVLCWGGSATVAPADVPLSTSATESARPIGGSIINFAHCVESRLSCFVLADGSIGLIRGANLHEIPGPSEAAAQQGVYHTGLGALQVCINTKHGVLAMGCSDVVLRLVHFDPQTLELLPNVPDSGDGSSSGVGFGWCDDLKGLGSVRSMQWSADATSLCVAFRKRGVAVFHYSGSCVMTTFGRYEGALPRTIASGLNRGCVTACWDSVGTRLYCCGVDAKEITVLPFRRVVEVTGSTVATQGSASASTVLMGAEGTAWLQVDGIGEGLLGGEGDQTASWESLEYPPDYLHENYPIRYGGVSGDGLHLACAGTHGAAVYSRRIRRWRLFSVRSQEKQISCVANPCWLADLVVVLPVRHHAQKCFELQFYPRFHLNDVSVLQRLKCDRRPVSVRCGIFTSPRGTEAILLMVLDTADVVRVYAVEVLADHCLSPRSISVDLKYIRHINLRDQFAAPLSVSLCPPPRQRLAHLLRRTGGSTSVSSGSSVIGANAAPPSSSMSTTSTSPTSPISLVRLLIVTNQRRLVVVDVPESASSAVLCHRDSVTAEGEVRCSVTRISGDHERIYGVWGELGALGQIFPNSSVVLTHDSGGLTLRWLEEHVQAGFPAPTVTPVALWRSRVSVSDVDSVPLGVVPTDGVVLLATEGLEPSLIASLPSRYRATIKPVLMIHRVLLPVIVELEARSVDGIDTNTLTADASSSVKSASVPVDDDGLVYATHVLQRLREQGSFVGAMDFLLHLILHMDENSDVEMSRLTYFQSTPNPTEPFAPLSASSSFNTTIPASVRQQQEGAPPVPKDRRRLKLLHAAIQWLKQFSEYHTVIVGVVRKIDISKWRFVFDVIGAPVDFFEDCLSTGCYLEAAHVVRVVMMDSVTQHTISSVVVDPALLALGNGAAVNPGRFGESSSTRSLVSNSMSPQTTSTGTILTPLQAAMQCGLRLLPHVLQPSLGLYPLAAELFRFLTMLLSELINSCFGADGTDGAALPSNGSPLSGTIGSSLRATLGSRLKGMWSSDGASTAATADHTKHIASHHAPSQHGQSHGAGGTSASSSLNLRFRSAHDRDNVAAHELLTRFRSVRLELERCILWDLISMCRFAALGQFCAYFTLDLKCILFSSPWAALCNQWRNESECDACATGAQGFDTMEIDGLAVYMFKRMMVSERRQGGGLFASLSQCAALQRTQTRQDPLWPCLEALRELVVSGSVHGDATSGVRALVSAMEMIISL